ncbi:Error-prone repair protein ImuA [Mucilaginibacter sp.]|uniref:ImuA family protein n=1 Tax=Mucilaginibacter sp. TaxID=1882438 RepID=UPI003266C43F
MPETRRDIINRLQKDILVLQGFKTPTGSAGGMGFGPVEAAFPNGIFPVGAVHEFLSEGPSHAAASSGFVGGILSSLMHQGGACVWISRCRNLFPPALKLFGIEPDRVIFIDLKHERDVLWATEEALKCEGLSAVIAEVQHISFTQSRRLQLAVEQSRVTGFILRNDVRKLSPTACVARWRVTPVPSRLEGSMPGVGFPRWNVELLKVRNGSPGTWVMEWVANKFVTLPAYVPEVRVQKVSNGSPGTWVMDRVSGKFLKQRKQSDEMELQEHLLNVG